jgi:hypothetical protein
MYAIIVNRLELITLVKIYEFWTATNLNEWIKKNNEVKRIVMNIKKVMDWECDASVINNNNNMIGVDYWRKKDVKIPDVELNREYARERI